MESWREQVAVLTVVLSVIILWRVYRRLSRNLIPGSYIRRGTLALVLILVVYIPANVFAGEGYTFPLILFVETLLCILLWTLRHLPGMKVLYAVAFWWGFLYLTLSGIAISFLDFGTAYFDSTLNHLHVGVVWIPFFVVFIVDHILRYEALIADTTRWAGFWSGVFLMISWIAGLDRGMVGIDVYIAEKEFHWGAVIVGMILLGLHLKRSWEHSRKRGWDAASREFWPSLRLLGPVSALAALFAFYPFMNHHPYEYLTGEYNWSKEEAQAKLANPLTGLAVGTINGSGIPPYQMTEGENPVSCMDLGCHADMREQFENSAHRFSANPAYQRVARILMKEGGITTTRVCATCHDPVPLITGQMVEGSDYPLPDSPGINCVVCHTLRPYPNKLENGQYQLMPQPLFFQSYYNFVLLAGGYMIVKNALEPHVQMWSPPHVKQSILCASCHTLRLNGHEHRATYSEWLEGHFGPKGEEPKTCIGCHMPVAGFSDSMGKIFHDHEFASANIALAGLGDASIEKRTEFIADSLKVEISAAEWKEDTVTVQVELINDKSGHNFPAAPKDLVEYWFEYCWNVPGEDPAWKPFPGAENIFKEDLYDQEGKPVREHELWRVVRLEGGNSIPTKGSRTFTAQVPLPPRARPSLSVRLMHRRFREDFVTPEMESSKLFLGAVEILHARKEF